MGATEIPFAEKLLLQIYLASKSNSQLDLYKISENIFNEVLRLKSACNRENIMPLLNTELLNIFLEVCNESNRSKVFYANNPSNSKDLSNFHLLCEGRQLSGYYLVQFYQGSNLLSCKCGSTFLVTKNGALRCDACGKYFSQAPAKCGQCHIGTLTFGKQNRDAGRFALSCNSCSEKRYFNFKLRTNIYKKVTDIRCPDQKCNNTISNCQVGLNVCSKCGFQFNMEYGNIFWCFGHRCPSPHMKMEELFSPDTLTVQHISDTEDTAAISSWLNRLLVLIPRAYCNTCGGHLSPIIYKNNKPRFFAATRFECSNNQCSEHKKVIYINHCSNIHCHHMIDSRNDTAKCANGFYICKNCYSCCNDYIFERTGSKSKGHMDKNEIYCPNCASQLMISKFHKDQFYCKGCKNKFLIKMEHKYFSKWKELQELVPKTYNVKYDNLKTISFSQTNESN